MKADKNKYIIPTFDEFAKGEPFSVECEACGAVEDMGIAVMIVPDEVMVVCIKRDKKLYDLTDDRYWRFFL